ERKHGTMHHPPQPRRSDSYVHATPTTPPRALSLHDALPIYGRAPAQDDREGAPAAGAVRLDVPDVVGEQDRADEDADGDRHPQGDRKSTRLNSSHVKISYAVFCLKKKSTIQINENDCIQNGS